MSKFINPILVTFFTMLFFSVSTVNAHESHTHTALWQACEDKQKAEICSYTNGDGDLFKGTCQLFSETLMCVRNQPIIPVEDLAKKAKNKVHAHSNSGTDNLSLAH
jgi:hypothetical protein